MESISRDATIVECNQLLRILYSIRGKALETWPLIELEYKSGIQNTFASKISRRSLK